MNASSNNFRGFVSFGIPAIAAVAIFAFIPFNSLCEFLVKLP